MTQKRHKKVCVVFRLVLFIKFSLLKSYPKATVAISGKKAISLHPPPNYLTAFSIHFDSLVFP